MTAADRRSSDPIRAFSDLVHDLRNQLTVLLACADAVARAVPHGTAAVEIGALIKSAGHASDLTEQLIVAATIGIHVPPERPGVLDLNEAIRSNLATMRRAVGPTVSLRLLLSPETVMVAADIVQIERILLNLVVNAREAMPDGGSVLVETTFVPADLSSADGPEPGHVRLTVTDMGVGMSPEIKARIFEPLFTTKRRGTGFGLNSVAHTVGALHGTVSVETAVGRGTAVEVTLPIASPRPPSAV
jgi:two-component system, cell cycle sensor histidine kinase and response regulator CckA